MVYIKRDLEQELTDVMEDKEIIAVVGPRQCGKTTMIHEILKGHENVNEISFDDVKLLNLFENDIDSFIETEIKGYDIVFIDEIQYAKESGKKLKYIFDKEKTKIIISGSSAAEISIQSLKYLVGRIFIFRLYPFSFKEYLRAKDEKLLKLYLSGKYGKDIIARINKHLHTFIIYGGYPRVVLDDSKKELILRNLYNTCMLREIKDMMNLCENDILIKIFSGLSLQIGNLINYNEIASIGGTKAREVKQMIQVLEETYICSRIKPYYTNKRTELIKTPKIFFIDTGFRNVCIDNFSLERTDMGALYENFIFSECTKAGIDLKFWRTKSGAEVDFIIEKEGLIPIELKSHINQTNTSRSFQSFINNYETRENFILSLDFQGNRVIKGKKIDYLPFVKFIPELNR